MNRVRIFPYNPGSRSAKTLATKTGWLRLLSSGSRFRPRANDVIVNWGSSRCPDFSPARVLNKRQSIMDATNKLVAIQRMQDGSVLVPPYWTSLEDCPSDVKLVARTVLTGHSGEGIVIGEKVTLPAAPLYTKYLPKLNEYRVHVVGGKAIFTQRKARKLDVENPNWEVRNLDGGFVYVACDDIEACNQTAVLAVAALGLDFGAVDIVHCKTDTYYYVLEVNTACGLEERTADKYAAAFKEMLNGEAI